ncbi:MAG: sarcosine oxidase subunit beta family protein [Alphaproteobacteria bacterium]|nr:MAG: sarcosine oxidase subunit beta family protein [Alphaproteobacteria bacterium]
MRRFSALEIVRNGLGGHRRWPLQWRDPAPKDRYDVIIIGGGGHGLATAYYLARNHGITNVAVLEKGWLGGGNTGRNTTIVRSNYMIEGNTEFYEHSLKLWEGLSQELNYNVMFSQRGQYNTFHTPAQRDVARRRANTLRLNGIEAELIDAKRMAAEVPGLDYSANARFPILGAIHQKRAGTARHDAVAWGYARGADARGIDIIQNCEVEEFIREGARIVGVRTTRGEIRAPKIGMAVAGHSSHLAAKAGLTLPIETHVLQAFVSEPLKPIFDTVISFGAAHFYISQSDKGGLVMGGDIDGYNSYAQKGGMPTMEHVFAAGVSFLPFLSRLKILRQWGGVMDMTMDGSPIICKAPIEGLYLNGGWCYGGFKATPASGWCFAHTIANDAPHDFNAKFRLDRFARGAVIDERGAGPTPHAH